MIRALASPLPLAIVESVNLGVSTKKKSKGANRSPLIFIPRQYNTLFLLLRLSLLKYHASVQNDY